MKKLNLIIFPGTGSPYNKLYKDVYALLSSGANKYGYGKIENTITYPGHIRIDGTTEGELTLDGAIETAISKVYYYENNGINYDFLGRSFGSFVTVKIAIGRKLNNLQRLILWGPPPYWLVWQMFVRDLEENRRIAKTKGVYVEETFFRSIIPLESMLSSLEYPTIIASGTKDAYSKPGYIEYLKSLFEYRNNISFRMVDDAPHEVTIQNCTDATIGAYLEALFG